MEFDFFIKKIDKENFDNIKDKIKDEVEKSVLNIQCDDNYYLYIFEIAFFDYVGIAKKDIGNIISKMSNIPNPNVSVRKLITIHKQSIEILKKHFKDKTKGTIDN